MNLATHLVRAGQSSRDQPAIAVGTQTVYTYGELADRVTRLASAMRGSLGLAPGDRVAIVMPNHPSYLEILYASWHAGLVAVPVNAKLHPTEFDYILSNSQTRVAFTTGALVSSLPDHIDRLIEVDSADYAALINSRPIDLIPRLPEDPAWLFYTSGTTGRPKGATLSHRNLLAAVFCYFADVDQGAPWGAILHGAPLSHGSGLYGLAHITQASCHVLPESDAFDPGEIFALIEHWPDLSMFAAPTMAKRLIDYQADVNPHNLKAIIYGGGPMYLDDIERGLERFGPRFAQLYGQGESPMTITALSSRAHADVVHPRFRERLASVGIAQSVVEVRIADADDNPVAINEPGEILARGDSVMLGYWNNPTATDAALKNGWLHTGDIGTMDEDGFLTLRDRSKDLIISGGSNIYPREIEETLLTHPKISEVSVIGIPDPDWGESVVAYVVAQNPNESPGIDVLDEHCLQSLARFKRPKHYRFVDELPKNNYGKVLKTALRDREQKKD